MSDTDDLEREIAALKKNISETSIEVAQLRKKKSNKGKIKVDCKGPGDGDKCPYDSFEFLPNAKTFFRCRRCWRENVDRDKKKWIPVQELEKKLNLHTKYWDIGPDGYSIRFGWDDRPLEKKYWEWWDLRKVTEETLPLGYYWCSAFKQPIKQSENACTVCSRRNDCNKHKIDIEFARLKEIEKQQSQIRKQLKPLLTSPSTLDKLIKKQNRKKRVEERKANKKKAIALAFKEITQVRIICGYCKSDFVFNQYYWAFDGTRWVRQVRGKMEMTSPQKKRCDVCYKKGNK